METTRIKVTTIDYCHRDQALKLSCGVLPKQLNENRKYSQDTNFVLSPVNLNIEVPEPKPSDSKLESLLEYLRQKPSQLKTYSPDFITNQRLLECIASSDYEQISVQVVNIDGVIYMLKSSEDADWNPNYDMVFEHFLTRSDENEEILKDGGIRRAVMMAEIPTGPNWNQVPIKVIYSAKIDAIDVCMQHHELKVSYEGTNSNFWKNDSCHCYWKSIFSKSDTLIIGSRTGRYPNDYKTRPPYLIPEYSLYELKSLAVQEIPLEAAKSAMNQKKPLRKHERRKTYWTIRQCEENLRNFLFIAQASIQVQGDCVISKTRPEDKWTVTKLDRKKAWFPELVTNRMSSKERGVLRSKSDVGMKETRSRLTNHRHSSPADLSDKGSAPREVLNPMYFWRKEGLEKANSSAPNYSTPPANNDYEMPRSLKWGLFRGSFSPPPRPTLSASVQTDDSGVTSPSSKSILKSPATDRSRSKSVSFSELVEGELESFGVEDDSESRVSAPEDQRSEPKKNATSDAENHQISSKNALRTQPKSKIVFNSPYDERQTNRLKITNLSDQKMGFEAKIKTKSTKNKPKIHLSPGSGSLDPGETTNVTVTCEEFHFASEEVNKDRIVIEWIIIPDGEEFNLEMMEGDGDFHRKTLIIEYND